MIMCFVILRPVRSDQINVGEIGYVNGGGGGAHGIYLTAILFATFITIRNREVRWVFP